MVKKNIFYVFLFGIQFVFGQNASTSLNINVRNVQLSSDSRTLSYDVYLQDISGDAKVAVPGFLVRIAIPQSDIGTNAKKMTITNATQELGVSADTVTQNGCDWILKFMNENFVQSYSKALVVSKDFPGTRIGTVNLMNANGTAFADQITLNLNHSGLGIKTKTTCSVFVPNSTTITSNSSVAISPSNFSGLGSYTLQASTTGYTINPNPASSKIKVTIGNNAEVLNIFEMGGKKVLSQLVEGNAEIDISSLAIGVYIVEINGIKKKLVKE
jgi:hypothetical protein